MTDTFYGSICTLALLIFLFSKKVHFLIFLTFFPVSFLFLSNFFRVHTILAGFTSGPSGRVGRLGARPCFRPWAGPSATVPAGLLSAGCCLVPRAAGLAGACCRADWLVCCKRILKKHRVLRMARIFLRKESGCLKLDFVGKLRPNFY